MNQEMLILVVGSLYLVHTGLTLLLFPTRIARSNQRRYADAGIAALLWYRGAAAGALAAVALVGMVYIQPWVVWAATATVAVPLASIFLFSAALAALTDGFGKTHAKNRAVVSRALRDEANAGLQAPTRKKLIIVRARGLLCLVLLVFWLYGWLLPMISS